MTLMKKSVVGFAAFAMMVIFALVDIITGIYGKELHVQEYIYNSFVIVALGSFGMLRIKNHIFPLK